MEAMLADQVGIDPHHAGGGDDDRLFWSLLIHVGLEIHSPTSTWDWRSTLQPHTTNEKLSSRCCHRLAPCSLRVRTPRSVTLRTTLE